MFFDSIKIKHIIVWASLVIFITFIVQRSHYLEVTHLVKSIYKQDIREIDSHNPLLFQKAIDINHTNFGQLIEIPGVGPKEAIRILNFVQKQGFLLSISELEFPEGPLSVREFQRIKVYIGAR